jgi:hypothetical protein
MAGTIEDQINARATTVSQPGQYIGFYEFATWSALRQRRVRVLFGENLLDLTELFQGPLSAVPTGNDAYVAAVQLQAGGAMLPAAAHGGGAGTNHFVIAVPFAGGDGVAHGRSASAIARKAGFVLRTTDATGDCGIDSLVFADGGPRTPASFRCLAVRLGCIHARPRWQQGLAGLV